MIYQIRIDDLSFRISPQKRPDVGPVFLVVSFLSLLHTHINFPAYAVLCIDINDTAAFFHPFDKACG